MCSNERNAQLNAKRDKAHKRVGMRRNEHLQEENDVLLAKLDQLIS